MKQKCKALQKFDGESKNPKKIKHQLWMFPSLKAVESKLFFQCTKMKSITLQNFNIQTCFSQFL